MLAYAANPPRVKRQYDEIQEPCVSKRQRFTGTSGSPAGGRCSYGFEPCAAPSPIHSAGGPNTTTPSIAAVLVWLRERFPDMDDKTVSEVLCEYGSNIEGAIRKLEQLTLSRATEVSQPPSDSSGTLPPASPSATPTMAEVAAGSAAKQQQQQPPPPDALQPSADDWVDFVVTSMATGFSSRDEANAKAREVLSKLEAFIVNRAGAEATAAAAKVLDLQKENYVLKRAVQIQNNKLQQQEEARIKMVAAHQEQIRALEIANYSLGLHLREATSGNALHGQRRPDIF